MILQKKNNWNFPKKVKFISSFGFVAPRILEKINSKRNLLEHEYKNPTEGDVEDALDISMLFIAYTDSFLNRTYDYFELELKGYTSAVNLPWINFKFNTEKCFFDITFNNHPKEGLSKEYKISANDEHFLFLLKKFVEFIRDG